MAPTYKRYFLLISYQGTLYHGWQAQPNVHTLEGTLQDAFQQVYGPVKLVGSSRTDTGVHAHKQVVHVDLAIGDVKRLQKGLNAVLPKDIAIRAIALVPKNAHARYDATARTYTYYVNKVKDPFRKNTSYYMPYMLNLIKMKQAAAVLIGQHNCASFCRKKAVVLHHRCHITKATWLEQGLQYIFQITANRFLHGMVRSLVGTLLSVGKGQLTLAGFQHVLQAQDRCRAGIAVPPHGLFLTDVSYPKDIFATGG